MVPYSGSVHPEILILEPGHCKILMRDRRKIRNHLDSIHAAALLNVGELATGLAFTAGLPKDARMIVVNLSIDFLKKARGDIFSECKTVIPTSSEKKSYIVESILTDTKGVEVAKVQATWLVSPIHS